MAAWLDHWEASFFFAMGWQRLQLFWSHRVQIDVLNVARWLPPDGPLLHWCFLARCQVYGRNLNVFIIVTSCSYSRQRRSLLLDVDQEPRLLDEHALAHPVQVALCRALDHRSWIPCSLNLCLKSPARLIRVPVGRPAKFGLGIFECRSTEIDGT